jgi:hypothetical protein
MTKQTYGRCSGLVLLVALGAAAASASVVTLQPTPGDLWDLDHNEYYTWGIDWTIPTGEVISSARLSIANINNWQVEQNNVLYVHLLDDPQSGTHRWVDNQGGGDAFAGQGVLLTTYTDDDPEPNPPENWSYDFTPAQLVTLTDYFANGRAGFGFDPDCHYFNDGVSLQIQTTIPEPASLLLLILGPFLGFRRR